METWKLGGLVQLALVLVAAGHCAGASATCGSIKFERGANSATVHGAAPADGEDCLRFSTGDGQEVQLSVRSAGNAVAFSVVGVADDRESLRFRGTKKTYEVHVFQTMKAASPVKYDLSVMIR